MSSFFTLPASQRKRKRPQQSSGANDGRTSKPSKRQARDESISASEASDDDNPTTRSRQEQSEDGSEDEDEDLRHEDPAAKRVRLAEQYLANTQREALDEAGFDAADVDVENLRRRMGDRLKEDTAETKGKMYRLIAEDMDWSAATCARFRTDMKSVTGVAIGVGHVYTVSKDMTLAKWALPTPDQVSRKPRKVVFSRGSKKTMEHHSAAILCVAASADGQYVVTGGADNRLIIWSAADLKPLKIFFGQHRDNGHRDSVMAVAFQRGSNHLFSASKDRTVKVWSCDELAYVETLFGHQDEVLDVDALGKEICVTAGARDRTARYWKVVEENQLIFRGGGPARGSRAARSAPRDAEDSGVDLSAHVDSEHEGSIERIAFVDDDTFVTGSDSGALSLWSVHKKKAVFSLPLAHGVDPLPPLDERSAESDPTNQYLDAEALMNVRAQPRWITALEALPFSDILVSGSWDGWVRAFRITPDKRRIEALGRIGESGTLIAHDASDKSGAVRGVINDLSIVDKGDRGKEGLLIAAAVGAEHRLGRWMSSDGKNAGCLFEVPRRLHADRVVEGGEADGMVEDGFDGFG